MKTIPEIKYEYIPSMSDYYNIEGKIFIPRKFYFRDEIEEKYEKDLMNSKYLVNLDNLPGGTKGVKNFFERFNRDQKGELLPKEQRGVTFIDEDKLDANQKNWLSKQEVMVHWLRPQELRNDGIFVTLDELNRRYSNKMRGQIDEDLEEDFGDILYFKTMKG